MGFPSLVTWRQHFKSRFSVSPAKWRKTSRGMAWQRPEESQFRVMDTKPVTLYGVTEYVGVSYQTVSRMVNQAYHVSTKTREEAEAAMVELNYIPSRMTQ